MTAKEKFGTAAVKPGEKSYGWVDVCIMADGSPLRIPVHVIAGTEPGPRVTVVSAQHGYEIVEIEVCRFLVENLDPRKIKGTLVIVPVASPITFEGGMRSTWIDSLYGDNGNMNRVWPGRADGWITERMVWTMGEELIKGSDVVIDLHGCGSASPGLSIYYGYCFSVADPVLTRRVRDISVASGFEILVKRAVPTLAGSLGQYAAVLGIPFFACEVGEFYGFHSDSKTQSAKTLVRGIPECGVTAIENIMKVMGMLEGNPKLPPRQVLISPENNIRPSHGGALYSNFDPTTLGRVIPKGTLLGTVVSPYTFETLEEIRAPYEQNMLLAITYRHPFARVNTGNYGYICADMTTAEWIENPQ